MHHTETGAYVATQASDARPKRGMGLGPLGEGSENGGMIADARAAPET
jgi:hypothetical protein